MKTLFITSISADGSTGNHTELEWRYQVFTEIEPTAESPMILSHLACVCYTSQFKGTKELLQLLLVFTDIFFPWRNPNSISLASSPTFPSSSLFIEMLVVY